ncbi:MAG: signal peptidase II [Acidobacteriia bacterium]|nr:signal peptidase II [Terriglobia bacterium]
MRFLYSILALSIFTLDRLTKTYIENHFSLYESINIIPGVLDFTHIRNKGMAFGILSNTTWTWMPFLLSIFASIAFILILIFALRTPVSQRRLQMGLMLILGGAIGNLYDRFRYGFVTDFIEVFYKSYQWPTFNIADSAITIGVGLLLVEILNQELSFKNKTS